MNSLQARLLAATGVILIAFVAATGFALERAVRERAELAERDKLQGMSYAMLGNAEISAGGAFRLPPGALPEAALARPDSGLYAMVLDAEDQVVWRSPSLLDRIPLEQPPEVGEWQFNTPEDTAGADWLTLSFGIRWVVESGNSYRYTLVVAENASPFYAQMQRFRGVLWAWLGLAAAILLALQVTILRLGLSPLRRVTRSLGDIEAGSKPRIDGEYPSEIRPLVNNLNAMLASEHQRLKRYRNALGDLAHSLKTPIAVLQGIARGGSLADEQQRQLGEQLGRMNEIVDYQLQRAAAAGTRTLAPPVDLYRVAEKVVNALRKVYHDRGTVFEISIGQSAKLAVDEGDLTEILGNLLDNAAKYGQSWVGIAIEDGTSPDILIDDDGPGFPEDQREQLLERGARADTRREGQGIGLAVATEIVHAYTGNLWLEASPQGGGRVRVRLPHT